MRNYTAGKVATRGGKRHGDQNAANTTENWNMNTCQMCNGTGEIAEYRGDDMSGYIDRRTCTACQAPCRCPHDPSKHDSEIVNRKHRDSGSRAHVRPRRGRRAGARTRSDRCRTCGRGAPSSRQAPSRRALVAAFRYRVPHGGRVIGRKTMCDAPSVHFDGFDSFSLGTVSFVCYVKVPELTGRVHELGARVTQFAVRCEYAALESGGRLAVASNESYEGCHLLRDLRRR
jgi:hypothetical protein